MLERILLETNNTPICTYNPRVHGMSTGRPPTKCGQSRRHTIPSGEGNVNSHSAVVGRVAPFPWLVCACLVCGVSW